MMTYVQLIEKVDLPTQVWLTFWDLDERVQLSMEIGAPENEYQVGEVFRLDREAGFEKLALTPVDPREVPERKLLIPVQKKQTRSSRWRRVVEAKVTIGQTRLFWRGRLKGKIKGSPVVEVKPEAHFQPTDGTRAHVSLLMVE
jgi:hypothetical protein